MGTVVFALVFCIHSTGQCTPANGFDHDDMLVPRTFSILSDCQAVASAATRNIPAAVGGVDYRCVPTSDQK